jgi:hypothetical protein
MLYLVYQHADGNVGVLNEGDVVDTKLDSMQQVIGGVKINY